MTESRRVEQQKDANLAAVIPMGAVMVLVAVPVLIHEARSADLASLVPWILVGGPILGLALLWFAGMFRKAGDTPLGRVLAPYGVAAAMAVSLLLVAALGGPTGVVVMACLYFAGWLFLFLSLALWIQRRESRSNP
jgi:hypothetical protein